MFASSGVYDQMHGGRMVIGAILALLRRYSLNGQHYRTVNMMGGLYDRQPIRRAGS